MFVITSNGRDGSRMIQTALDAHSQLTCRGELFGSHYADVRMGHSTAASYLQATSPSDAYGFRLITHQARNGPCGDAREFLNGRAKVIHVKRRDLLAQHVSRVIAKKTGRTQDYQGTHPTTMTVEIGQHVARFAMHESARNYRRSQMEFCDSECINVVYEDVVADFEGTMVRLFNFLGVRFELVEPGTYRQERRPLSEVITNWDELPQELKATALVEKVPQMR